MSVFVIGICRFQNVPKLGRSVRGNPTEMLSNKLLQNKLVFNINKGLNKYYRKILVDLAFLRTP